MVAAVADDWLGSAMRDGGIVAELLLSLKEAKVKPAVFAYTAVTALRWGIRQPRSRSPRCDGLSQRRDADSAKNSRCSPSTPLSWSGGSSSPSACADGYEATSCQISSSLAVGSRSKVVVVTEDSSSSRSGSSTKRIRRKKTFAELKEEEGNLLKERILKKEIVSLRATIHEQGAENQSLKRMKLDQKKIHQNEPSLAHQNSHNLSGHGSAVNGSMNCYKTEEEKTMDSNFLLPDLNMALSEDNDNEYSPCIGQG